MRRLLIGILLGGIVLGTPQLVAGEKQKTLVFKKTPQADLKMTIHFPPNWRKSDKRSAIVFFFGGGWRGGSVKQFLPQAKYLAKRGMVAARADYRVLSRHKTKPDKCVEDCKSAVRYLRENAAKLGIDPNRIVASGGSAGGHTAACTFLAREVEPKGENLKVSSQPNLMILYNPALDTLTEKIISRVGSKEMAKKISPVHNLTKDTPPTIIFYGTKDFLLDGAHKYMAKAKELGVKAEMYFAEGQRHGFFNRSPWMEATLFEADRFLVRHGFLKGNPAVKPKEGARMELVKKSP